MRILVAPDSFKESLKASQAAHFIAAGIRRVLPDAQITQIPLSDGGEGLTEALTAALGGQWKQQEVTGPLGEKVAARLGVADSHTAIIEMAQASGLELVPRELRNPMLTTTYGTGELIKAALDQGCSRIIMGIGGSATNDGGAGMAQALGARLLNRRNQEIPWGAQGLLELEHIDLSALDSRVRNTEIRVACDVANPLLGPTGAARVYGPQKGAGHDMVKTLEQALQQMSTVIQKDLRVEVSSIPGGGAAGGLGAGLLAFAGAQLESGLNLVMEILDLDRQLASGYDLVITGEGAINGQSLYGKVPVGLARRAKRFGLPVIALVGSIGMDAEAVLGEGIDALVSLVPGPMTLEEALAGAGELLEEAAARTMRLLLLGTRLYS